MLEAVFNGIKAFANVIIAVFIVAYVIDEYKYWRRNNDGK